MCKIAKAIPLTIVANAWLFVVEVSRRKAEGLQRGKPRARDDRRVVGPSLDIGCRQSGDVADEAGEDDAESWNEGLHL